MRYHDTVRPEWIDYNGHLSEPFYVMVFGFATDHLMDETGMDADYRDRTASSLYTVEAHVRYLREVGRDAALDVDTAVVAVTAKTVRFCHEMRVAGALVATKELLGVHVTNARAAPFPDEVAGRLRSLVTAAPAYAGRAIA